MRKAFSLDPLTAARIAELAEALGLSQSGVVDQAILALTTDVTDKARAK